MFGSRIFFFFFFFFLLICFSTYIEIFHMFKNVKNNHIELKLGGQMLDRVNF